MAHQTTAVGGCVMLSVGGGIMLSGVILVTYGDKN